MEPEIIYRLVIAQTVLLGFQIVIYFGVEIFEKDPHDVSSEIDGKIPLVPITALLYILWFPLIALFPVFLYGGDPEQYGIYMASVVADIIISAIIYLAYPTTFERAEPPQVVGSRLLKLIYRASFKGMNCVPSLHCSLCYIVIACSFAAVGLSPAVRAVAIITAVLIVISTLTTKQHVMSDVVSELPVAAIAVAAGVLVDNGWLISFIGGVK